MKLEDEDPKHEAAIRAAGWSQNRLGKWVHPDHESYAAYRPRYVCEDFEIKA